MRLGGPRARFWRPRTRFLRPRGSIWEGSGTISSRFLARMPRKPRTPRTPAKTRPRSQMRQEWVGGGAWGVSMELEPSWSFWHPAFVGFLAIGRDCTESQDTCLWVGFPWPRSLPSPLLKLSSTSSMYVVISVVVVAVVLAVSADQS